MLEQLTGFITSLAGLITAIATLLGGLAALIGAWPKGKSKERSDMSENREIKQSAATVAVLLLTISAGIFVGRLTAESPDPVSRAVGCGELANRIVRVNLRA